MPAPTAPAAAPAAAAPKQSKPKKPKKAPVPPGTPPPPGTPSPSPVPAGPGEQAGKAPQPQPRPQQQPKAPAPTAAPTPAVPAAAATKPKRPKKSKATPTAAAAAPPAPAAAAAAPPAAAAPAAAGAPAPPAAKPSKPKAANRAPSKAATEVKPAESAGAGRTRASPSPKTNPKATNKPHAKAPPPAAANSSAKSVESKTVNGDAAPAMYVPKTPVTLPVLNTLHVEVCAALLGNLLDFTPSIGYALAHLRPFQTTQHLVDQLHGILDGLPASYLQGFVKRFKELGLVAKSKLTAEQKSCLGLEKLPDSAKEELVGLYSQYSSQFGFPFVVCAQGLSAGAMPGLLRARLQGQDRDQELRHAVHELKKIAALRLRQLVSG